MSVTVLGVVALVALLGVWFVRREWTQYVLGAAAAFPQTAGLIVAGNGLPLFYLCMAAVALLAAPHGLLALSRLGRNPRLRRERLAPDIIGMALVAWAAVITIAGPRIFAGMRVFAPDLGVDAQVSAMAVLAPSLGNLAQLGYLGMGVLLLLVAGRVFPVGIRMLGTALWVAVVLAAVRIVAEPVWPHALLQNMPGVTYATAERLSGTFYEPSVLGLYLTAAAGYFGARLVRSTTAAGRIAAGAALLLVALDFFRNASGTALLGLAILVGLAGIVGLVRVLRAGRLRVRPLAVVGVVAAFGVALGQLPLIAQLTVGSAADKVGSASFAARTAADSRAAQILVESGGLGIGLGSNRPSSLAMLIASCLGVIGLALFAALVVLALRRGLRRELEPLAWGLGGVLVAAIIAVPDLSTPAIWVGLAGCLCSAIPDRDAAGPTATSTPVPAARGATARDAPAF